MITAIFAGSFDPFTIEHEYIARTAAKIFDTLFVVVAVNDDKKPMFSAVERVAIANKTLVDVPNIACTYSDKLIFDVAKEHGAEFLVRGLRHTTEYEYELRLATGNLLVGNIQTVGIFPRTLSVSSSDVRLLIKHKNAKWKDYVSPQVQGYIEEVITERKVFI